MGTHIQCLLCNRFLPGLRPGRAVSLLENASGENTGIERKTAVMRVSSAQSSSLGIFKITDTVIAREANKNWAYMANIVFHSDYSSYSKGKDQHHERRTSISSN